MFSKVNNQQGSQFTHSLWLDRNSDIHCDPAFINESIKMVTFFLAVLLFLFVIDAFGE